MPEQANPLDSFVEPDFEKVLGGIDPKLVTAFFNYFSRFEHALKMRGLKKIRSGFIVGVEWSNYSPAINYPTKVKAIDEAVEYLCSEPVKRQKEDLSWENTPAIANVTFDDALRQIPYIRNNLFHGGKYLKPDAKRDNSLLEASIVLIKACLINDAALLREFNYYR
ncbi:hypothetical protein [Citrobacter braakii]|uniref:hypothetical protein n=1 Tax=Citrobacter braakii TaxID=57706 RepID=UPI00103EA8B7|nr:hypothetical protein [Citrobacter braakii]TCC60735.1 hypothetical protein EY918_04720 [Citrobacter braakii]